MRAGEGHLIKPKVCNVVVYDIKLLSCSLPKVTLEIRCGRGTYMRSIARDLAKALGTCGYASKIKRTGDGPFKMADVENLRPTVEIDGIAFPFLSMLEAIRRPDFRDLFEIDRLQVEQSMKLRHNLHSQRGKFPPVTFDSVKYKKNRYKVKGK